MLISTPGYVLHTIPYAETSVVAKVFTRQLGVKSYLVKGVRSRTGRVKQNLLQPLSCLDMVVYDNPRTTLNYIKEMSHRGRQPSNDAIDNALRFFMTEVLYRSLHEEEPMPELFDYVEHGEWSGESGERRDVPIRFLLTVARHLGIEPMDNYSTREPWFDLQDGRFVAEANETTISVSLSLLLHQYLTPETQCTTSLRERTDMLNALIAYFQLHLSSFKQFHSHEILHTILK